MTTPERAPLPLVATFVKDKDPSFYGRYRLRFDQVAPRFADYRGLVRVRPGSTPALDAAIGALDPRQNWPFQRINRGRHARGYSLEPGPADEDLLSFELLSDVCYIDMRNFRWAMSRFAPHLEDAHFFVLSTGDGEDRWLDEYRFTGGAVSAERWLWEPDLFHSRREFYRALARERPDDALFREFMAFVSRP